MILGWFLDWILDGYLNLNGTAVVHGDADVGPSGTFRFVWEMGLSISHGGT